MKEIINNLIRYKFLLQELVKKGIKLKYRRSYLGIVWTMLEPLLTMIVLTFVFGEILGRGDKTFPIYVLAGRLLYSFYSGSTKVCARSIRANASMIKKVYVPKYLYPLSSVIYNYIIFLLSLIVLVVVALVLGVTPTLYLIQAIIPLILLFVFALGSGLILSALGVFFRDIEYLWDVALMLIMYTCAIFYYPDRLMSGDKAIVLKCNPLYCIIANFRNAVFGEWMDVNMLVYSGIFTAGVFLVGVLIFYKKQDEFILHI